MRHRRILILLAGLIVLGAAFLVTTRQEPGTPVVPQPLVWSIGMDDLMAVTVSLPSAGKREAWVKHDDKEWYFDQPDGPRVNPQRWGGGIPLLLSGARAERLIFAGASPEQLEIYGLNDPHMTIDLVLENGTTIGIAVGMTTPDGRAYYVKRSDTDDVYAVDQTWPQVVERLVTDPPYPEPN